MSHQVVVDWFGESVTTLADLIPPSPRAVIVGINPSPVSVEAGHYYQGQLGKRLWGRLASIGLIDLADATWEDDAAVAAGLGFADVVKRPTARADALRSGEREHGARLLVETLVASAPRSVIFTFKDAAQAVVGRVSGAGWIADATVAGAPAFVMPGPYTARDEAARMLAELATHLR